MLEVTENRSGMNFSTMLPEIHKLFRQLFTYPRLLRSFTSSYNTSLLTESFEVPRQMENTYDWISKMGKINITPSKKKIALLVSYSGKDCFGMQWCHNSPRTIEHELLNAMVKASIIQPEAIKKPWLVRFSYASRTDKSVSAVRQVISVEFANPQRHVIKTINEHLPPQIRLVGWKRTTAGFDPRSSCTARTYSYMLPTFAFARLTEISSEQYRISNEVISEVNALLHRYVGRHNFHNYTLQKKADDPSCRREILSCKCGLPFVIDGIEFVVIEIKGCNFMLHQIRKMIGLVIAIVRGLAPPSIMIKAWGPKKIDMPKAPGVGLMLENVHYDSYNEHHGSDGIHEPLTWEEFNDFVHAFKQEHIIPAIVNAEKHEKSMLKWLRRPLFFATFDEPRSMRSPFINAYGKIEHYGNETDHEQDDAAEGVAESYNTMCKNC